VGRRATSILPRGRAVAANDTERQSSARLDPLIETVVNGRFRIHRAIARGGMGRVYLATQEPLGRPVALKVVRDDLVADALRPHERFVIEADILSRIQHPNIVTIHDFGELDGPHRGQSFIAMEFLDGQTLADRMVQAKRLAASEVVSLTTQIARGLRAVHERGIVHRDLKPSNILIVPDSDGDVIVKLVDFGIGKLFWEVDATRPDLTAANEALGTPHFMAPEQFDGLTRPAADLYAVGAIMFLALTGGLPFESRTTGETLKNKMSRPAPRIRERAPDLPVTERLESLVAALLSQTPEERPSASMLLRELEACRRELEATTPPQFAPSAPLAAPATTASLARPTSRSDVPAAPALCVVVTPGPSATHAVGAHRSRLARLTPYVVGVLVLYGLGLVYGFTRGDSLLHNQAPVIQSSAAASSARLAVGVGASREEHVVVVSPVVPKPVTPKPVIPKPTALVPPSPAPESAPVPPPLPRVQIFSTEGVTRVTE